jgi:hypothetical protein
MRWTVVLGALVGLGLGLAAPACGPGCEGDDVECYSGVRGGICSVEDCGPAECRAGAWRCAKSSCVPSTECGGLGI